jgi:LysR family glycine cleavage system transcriptional activator
MARIPSVAALRAFEATVRLGGLARAAAELNISTSAVSHQISGLEESLGVRLLERSSGVGGIHITSAGARLLPAASNALSLLEDACSDICGTEKPLIVSANVPLSTMWLARRLAEFSAQHPGTSVHAIILDGEPDFSRHNIDLAVVHVPEKKLLPNDVILLREHVFPVCAPDLTFTSDCCLLEEEHEDNPEIDWQNWASFGLPAGFSKRIVRYSSFSQVIGAAVGGAGLALGRSPLIDSDLASGRLVRLLTPVSKPASWRSVLRRGPGRRHRMVEMLIDFLHAEAEAARPLSAI